MSLLKFIIVVFGLCVSSVVAYAEEQHPNFCKGELSYEEFRALVLHHSLVAAEIDGEYSKRLAEAVSIKQLINPDVYIEQTYTTMDIGGADDSQANISVGQPLRLSDFGKRASVAKLLDRSSELDKKLKLLEMVQSASIKFKTLYDFQRLKEFLMSALEKAKSKLILVQSGVSKGLFPKSDELLFEGEMYKIQAQVENAEFLLSNLRSELSLMSGLKCEIRAQKYDPPKPLLAAEVLIKKSQTNELGVRERVQILSQLSKEQESLAKLDVIPIITPRFVYQHTNDGGDFFGAGISIPLPLFNLNHVQRMHAEADSKISAKREKLFDDGGIENQILQLHKALSHLDRQVFLLKDKVLPAYNSSLNFQEKAYQEGKGNILQVWQLFKEYNQTYIQSIQLSLDTMNNRIQLSTLIGEELP